MEAFVARVRTLTDEDRVAVAEARKRVSEPFHEKALAAAAEALAGRADLYLRARRALVGASLPQELKDEAAAELDAVSIADLNEVARHVWLALDDALLAVLGGDVLHPDHARELYRSLKAASIP